VAVTVVPPAQDWRHRVADVADEVSCGGRCSRGGRTGACQRTDYDAGHVSSLTSSGFPPPAQGPFLAHCSTTTTRPSAAYLPNVATTDADRTGDVLWQAVGLPRPASSADVVVLCAFYRSLVCFVGSAVKRGPEQFIGKWPIKWKGRSGVSDVAATQRPFAT